MDGAMRGRARRCSAGRRSAFLHQRQAGRRAAPRGAGSNRDLGQAIVQYYNNVFTGATDDSYVPAADDVGHTLRAVITATTDFGATTTAR